MQNQFGPGIGHTDTQNSADQRPAAKTPPVPFAPAAAAMRQVPREPKFALDPSIPAPASGSPDFRRPPATHIPPPPTAASTHPDIGPAWPRPPRRRESDAASASARAVSRPGPYPAHGWPANRATPPSTSLPAIFGSTPGRTLPIRSRKFPFGLFSREVDPSINNSVVKGSQRSGMPPPANLAP